MATTRATSGPSPSAGGVARNAALSIDRERFRELGHHLIDAIADRLAAIPAGRVTPGETPGAVRQALGVGGALPERGADPRALLDRATALLFDHSLFNGHPRFFGYITSSPAPIGMLGDLLSAAVNPNVGAWALAPAATEIEAETVRWVAELIGYPADCGGLMVSGGNMANFIGFFAARAAGADWSVREKGIAGGEGRKLRAYVSAETHTWIQKAADLSGIGTDAIRWIPCDAEQRMDMASLRSQIDEDRARGDRPFLVVGTAGSVSTGAVDPLPEIASLCREQKLWFHVDGAYGGFAARVPGVPSALRALSEADSVAVDPHKWLYAPLEAGCALVRDPEHLIRAFSYHPPYYHLEEKVVNFVDFGPQNSRGFRALKVWLALQQVGAAGHRELIAEDIELSRAMAERIERHPELERVTQALSIVTFRFVPGDLRARVGEADVEAYLNDLNRELLDRSQRAGEVFVSNAVIGDRYVLRACIVNFHTARADVEATPDILARMGRQLDAAKRPAGLRAARS
ncbi:MAG TPA: aminotransferase class V-fold PLP-dependent enzyme [Candidatus Sulfotelmatobacter sp.]|nr:aminotransferase class V-fold PLP-dependent enzyme [Candidatus Sulfotelmatobacter sp.]